MSNIDTSRIITAEAKRASHRAARQTGAKAACRRRILALVDETTQMNLVGALLAHNAVVLRGGTARDATKASGLTEEDIATVLLMRGWIAAMRGACPAAARDPATPPEVDDHWPAPPPGLASLAARF